MSADALYRQVVLDHHRNPRRYGALDDATHRAEGINPLCGDRLKFELRCVDGRVAALGFTGEACAIATAAASMLGELVMGVDAAGFEALRATFSAWLAEPAAPTGVAPADPSLGALAALAELRNHRARHPCALLPFETIAAALAARAIATTEESRAHE